MTTQQVVGARAEARAATFLRAQGFTILKKNVHTPYGEIDLLAQDGTTLVFVEVRYRRTPQFGEPEETVAGKKLTRLQRSAEWYVSTYAVQGAYRIDVLGITGDPTSITHLRDVQ